MLRSIAIVAALLFAADAARAAQADCHDYSAATGEDRALFNGYIYGFVSAKLKGASPTEINSITMKVVRETDKYCILQPADDPHGAIAVFTEAEVYDRRRR